MIYTRFGSELELLGKRECAVNGGGVDTLIAARRQDGEVRFYWFSGLKATAGAPEVNAALARLPELKFDSVEAEQAAIFAAY